MRFIEIDADEDLFYNVETIIVMLNIHSIFLGLCTITVLLSISDKCHISCQLPIYATILKSDKITENFYMY